MTSRRPQDPRTKRIPDEEAGVRTMTPGGGSDPGATVVPDDHRHVATADPGATVLPDDLEAPKPRAARGGPVRGGAATVAERTMTADSLEAVRQQVRAKAEAQASTKPKKKRGAGWGTWVVAFLLLGGIGFGVAWLVMNPPGGGGETVAAADPEADAAGEPAAADAASEAGAADAASEAGAADAAGEVSVADVAGEASGEVAVAAASDAAGETGDAVGAVGDAASSDAVAQSDVVPDAATTDTAAATPDGAAGEVAVAQADAAPSPTADTTAAIAPAPDAMVAAVDAMAPEVAAPPKPFIANPIEATRLNEDGLAARKAGDNAGAMRLYEKALAADPDHVWARYNYACELAIAGRAKDALAELTKLYKLGTADARRALQAARKDSDFRSIKDMGQFFRLTNF